MLKPLGATVDTQGFQGPLLGSLCPFRETESGFPKSEYPEWTFDHIVRSPLRGRIAEQKRSRALSATLPKTLKLSKYTEVDFGQHCHKSTFVGLHSPFCPIPGSRIA